MRKFIEGSYYKQIRKGRQRVETRIAVQSVTIHRGIPEGENDQAGNGSKHKHQSKSGYLNNRRNPENLWSHTQNIRLGEQKIRLVRQVNWQYFAMSSSMVSVYKVVKQEMSAEEVERVEHGKYLGEGSLCWLGLTGCHYSDHHCNYVNWESNL